MLVFQLSFQGISHGGFAAFCRYPGTAKAKQKRKRKSPPARSRSCRSWPSYRTLIVPLAVIEPATVRRTNDWFSFWNYAFQKRRQWLVPFLKKMVFEKGAGDWFPFLKKCISKGSQWLVPFLKGIWKDSLRDGYWKERFVHWNQYTCIGSVFENLVPKPAPHLGVRFPSKTTTILKSLLADTSSEQSLILVKRLNPSSDQKTLQIKRPFCVTVRTSTTTRTTTTTMSFEKH